MPGTPTGTGHAQSKLVTPDGVVPGAIIYNKTTDTIQVGASTNTFRNINSQHSAAQSTTSGQSVTFTDVPIWANKITIMFHNVGHDDDLNSRPVKVQLGTGSGILNTGYVSRSISVSSSGTIQGDDETDAFTIEDFTSNRTVNGHMLITKFDSSTYISSHTVSGGPTVCKYGAGELSSIPDTITQVKIFFGTGSGYDFDGGSIKLLYEA